MIRLALLLVLAAMIFGAAGLAMTSEEASAGPLPAIDGPRINLECEQVSAPGADGVGTVECTLTVDFPDGVPLDDLVLTITATYEDRDGDGSPSPGDRLLCITVELPDGTVLFDRCRPGVE